MTGFCILCIVGLYGVSIFFSEFNTLSYKDVSMSASLFRYINSDDFSLGLTISPLSGITCTGILSYGSDVGMMSSSIPGTKYSLCALRNIFRVYSGLVIFESTHLTSLVNIILLV